MSWFTVDRKGLAKLLEKKGKAFALIELIQNSWDTGATEVMVDITKADKRGIYHLEVEDNDPEGFKDLSHAFTLFAESEKKSDPTKRGRFNLGEKLVLAMCTYASISSTKGTYEFLESKDGDVRSRCQACKRKEGSLFKANIRMTREEYLEALDKLYTLIQPKGVKTFINQEQLGERVPLKTFETSLPTEIADNEGILRRTVRRTTVEVYNPVTGETPSIYELGIPVVETEDKWHINIQQKVPLNMNRDNVTPAYLRTLRTLVFNAMHQEVSEDDASASWVREATSDERCTPEAMQTAVTHRFGERAVAFDPGDIEANKRAVAAGYTVIPGRSMNKSEWANIKRTEIVKPAGQVTPTPKPYAANGRKLKLYPKDKITTNMAIAIGYCRHIGESLLGMNISVRVANDRDWGFAATYGNGQLTLNVGSLGKRWFDIDNIDGINELLIHEFGHHFSDDHLSEKYYDGLCRLGAKLAKLALDKPNMFPT